MNTPDELIDELQFNNKWLTDEYKQSNYYRDYLKQISQELINETFKV